MVPEEVVPVKRKGGFASHTWQTCGCNPCKARRRKEAALAGTTGDGGEQLVSTVEIEDKKHSRLSKGPSTLVTPAISKRRRDVVARWVEMRFEDPSLSKSAAAKILGIKRHTLNDYIYWAQREGWLKFQEPMDRLEFEIIPKVVDNLNTLMNEKDRVATLETAKGILFPVYREAKGIQETPTTVLALKIETIDPSTTLKTMTGQIVGQGRALEGETVNE